MSAADENVLSGVAQYIHRGRELAAEPRSAFRIGHAIRTAPDLPLLDRDRIGHLKFNLAKTIQSCMRNARGFERDGLQDAMAQIITGCICALDVLADCPTTTRRPRTWRPGVDD